MAGYAGEINKKESKKNFSCICIAILLSVYLTGSQNLASGNTSCDCPQVSAKSAIVMIADTGQVIYEKNPHEKLPMASTTKIMTALLTLEEAVKDNKEITITKEMISVEGSSLGLREGDILTLESLARGMLAVSGNDAANSAAIAVSGSIDNFVKKMNEKANMFGMSNTHFVTPSGLDRGDHHSTAYDMAILASHALENEMFLNIVSKPSIPVPFINPKSVKMLKNSNRLLREYNGAIGVKTGYTILAKRCLVSSAERNGIRLIAVTLNDVNDWDDHKKMLDFGFANCEKKVFGKDIPLQVPVVGGEKDMIDLTVQNPVTLPIKKGCINDIHEIIDIPNFVYAPISKNDVISTISYEQNGKIIAKINLIANEACSEKYVKKNIFQKIKKFFLRR